MIRSEVQKAPTGREGYRPPLQVGTKMEASHRGLSLGISSQGSRARDTGTQPIEILSRGKADGDTKQDALSNGNTAQGDQSDAGDLSIGIRSIGMWGAHEFLGTS